MRACIRTCLNVYAIKVHNDRVRSAGTHTVPPRNVVDEFFEGQRRAGVNIVCRHVVFQAHAHTRKAIRCTHPQHYIFPFAKALCVSVSTAHRQTHAGMQACKHIYTMIICIDTDEYVALVHAHIPSCACSRCLTIDCNTPVPFAAACSSVYRLTRSSASIGYSG
jgi:hypothetical protein